MKKILLLTNMYPSQKHPSYGIFVKKTYDWLAEKYDVKLVKIHKTNCMLMKIFAYIRFNLQAILRGVFERYDCVYAHYISHCAFAIKWIRFFRKDITIIGNIHGEDVFSQYEEFNKNRGKAKDFITRCDGIIAPSEYFRDRVCKEYPITMDQVFVSPSGGIDVKLFCPQDKDRCREKMGLEKDKIYIGFVSRIEKGKGWDIFLEAIRKISNEKLNVNAIIVGDGKEMAELKQYVGENNLTDQIVFFPLLPHEELVLIYNSMDVFCFPSRIKAESLGLVGLEAMACGIPSLITNYEGPSSYAKDGINCMQFDPANSEELKEKIRYLLDSTEAYRDNLVRNAQKTALYYDSNEIKKQYVEFFDNCLEKS